MKNFNRFDDISHRPLRIYNRAVMAYNIQEDQGRATMVEYLETFSPEERKEIAQMVQLVLKKGIKEVQRLVTDGVEFSDEPYILN